MIRIKDIAVQVGAFKLAGINLEIPSGAYGVLMGRTGSGKTTLLEIICGLRSPASGEVLLNGQDVTTWRPSARNIGYVPQDRSLFSTMTVRENLAFGLEIRGWPEARREERVMELADWLQITPLLERRPRGLSGGEAQRVALGRALAFNPPLLCLDEPLSALDDQTRREMQGILRRVHEQTGVTVLHVTHHSSDAEELADIVLRLEGSAVSQTNLEPLKLLQSPRP